MSALRVLRPAALDRLGRRHAVVEASAGTGKTYILEHLVVDLLLRHGAELEQILVVTFTEKATAELVGRVRSKLTELRDVTPEHRLVRAAVGAADDACWILDERARQKLSNALLSFDRASITTIHGFCQRLLADHAFLNGRLFREEVVDEAATFHAAFVEALRADVAADPAIARYLDTWLRAGGRLAGLERRVLLECYRHTGRQGTMRELVCPAPFDEAAFSKMLSAFPEIAPDDSGAVALKAALKVHKVQGNTANAIIERMGRLALLAHAHRNGQSVETCLATLESWEKRKNDFFGFCLERLPDLPASENGPGRTLALFRAIATATVPIAAELAHRLLPLVAARLDKRKRSVGLLDFQDMLWLVAQSLDGDGPRQRALVGTLRGRFRHALIDEFQDTDDIQWGIFERLFLRSDDGHVLTVIGDPKQAIYSFRGADVHTYLRAADAIRGTDEPVFLTANHRSTAALIDAYNAILDQEAANPFFRAAGGIRYQHPVVCGRTDLALVDARGAQVAPVRVLDLQTQDPGILTVQIKQALKTQIVQEIRQLLSPRDGLRMRSQEGERALAASDIFVLTRTVRESREVGEALRAAQIPFAYFKQERLFETVEASEVLDVLRAIADPDDPTARARAWITAFFGLTLPDLAACEDLPPGHSLLRLLYEWKGLADAGQLETLLARLVEDSGIVCREIFLHDSERALTNYLHVLEILQEEVARSRCTLRELTHTLGAYVNGARKPPGQNSDVQRLETDAQAVQIMTIHQAKGLEAAVVFVYGGLWKGPRGEVRAFHDETGRRVIRVGPPPPDEEKRVEQEADDEERRVLYVALTRARGRLYLPRYPQLFKKLQGAYKTVNARLDDLLGGFTDPAIRKLFEVVDVPCRSQILAEVPAPVSEALTRWQPPPALLADSSDRDLDVIANQRAGLLVTSYSAVKRRHGGFVPAEPQADDPAANELPADAADIGLAPDELPRGRRSGSFLHELLEEVPLETLRGRPSLDEWRAQPAVRALFERMRRRHDRRSAHLAHAERLVHTALTAKVPLGDTVIAGLASAEQIVREMEFVYPIPERGQPLLGTAASGEWKIERGVVKGFVDLLFEHEGRVYVCDWKGDWLPSWDDASVRAHCERNYDTQARLYTLAALRWLRIDSESRHHERFGGVLYCFLRGMQHDPNESSAGIHFHRPAWDEVIGWEQAMLRGEFWGLSS